MRMLQKMASYFRGEKGQAMTEYILATVLATVVIGAGFAVFFFALRGYYGLLTFIIALPVP